MPAHQNLLVDDPGAARSLARGRLELAVCAACGFIFNRVFTPDLLHYGDRYDNRQECSPAFDEYLMGLVEYLVADKGIRNRRVVEVGCGNGYFIKRLAEVGQNTGFGFDPSYAGPMDLPEQRLSFKRCFYGPDCAVAKADAVICRHVIEHVPDPMTLLRSISGTLAPGAFVFFETPDVEWILRHHAFWDFFYEHCSYFSRASLSTVFEMAGFEVRGIRPVFGGQYLWLEAAPDGSLRQGMTAKKPGQMPRLALAFGRHFDEWLARQRTALAAAAGSGILALWGAGAKGVTFANLLDQDRTIIDCVIDINPAKQGRYLPGTGHPIVDIAGAVRRGVTSSLQMNPNYRTENMLLLQEAGSTMQLINPIELNGNEQ